MKKTIKTLSLPSMVLIFLLTLPIHANAGAVSWSSENYEVQTEYSYGQFGYGWDYNSGPPLPISASAGDTNIPCDNHPWSANITAESNVSASTMSAYTNLSGVSCTGTSVDAVARFDGTYTAVEPFFVLSYDFANSGYSNLMIWVFDTTQPSWLLKKTVSSTYSETLYIPTTVGNTINVDFDLQSNTSSGTSSGLVTYTMNTSVAPEPISSILFVTGGSLLAGRRYLKSAKARKYRSKKQGITTACT